MKWLYDLNSTVSGVVWGIPMLVLIIGAGLYLSFRTGFIQIFRFRYALKNTLGKIFKKQKAGKGAVTPFQALTTALASTVGTGNIAGVTSAVTLGGPGAIFWLWVSAVIGMCTKYAEVVLAIRFRERNRAGEWTGGPMYYIRNGLGKRFEWLAVAFSIFGAVAALGVGNAVQVGNMTDSICSSIASFIPSAAAMKGVISLAIGLVVALITALTLFGGVKRIGRVTEVLVPFMAVGYVLAALTVIIMNIGRLGPALFQIFGEAFKPEAAAGGAAGISIKTALSWGFRRGVFTNEAGLGSAPIAHAASSETNPVRQGLYGIMEVFIDTIVMCTLTGLALLMSGISLPYGAHGTISLNISAFATVFGPRTASVIISAGMTFFALATVLGWSLYGTRCVEFLFGSRSIKPYHAIYVVVVVAGATMNLESVWQLADTLNGLMAIPNLIAVLALSGVVVKLTREHFEGKAPRLASPEPKQPAKRGRRVG